MVRQSAPWLKQAPPYNPADDAHERNPHKVSHLSAYRAARARKRWRSGRNTNPLFVLPEAPTAEEDAPKRRLCKNDFRRLQRYQNHRMRAASVCRFAIVTTLLLGWMLPVYLLSHAAAVGAISHQCSVLIQSALASPTLKHWLSMVNAA